MKRKHEGHVRGFVHGKEAYYFAATSYPERVDYITVGFYSPAGGTSGEFEIQWEKLSGKVTPCLKVWDDSWSALFYFGDVLAQLATLDGTYPTPEQVMEKLLACGVVDQTPRVDPHPKPQRVEDKAVALLRKCLLMLEWLPSGQEVALRREIRNFLNP